MILLYIYEVWEKLTTRQIRNVNHLFKQEAAVKKEAMKEGSSFGFDSRLTLTR